MKKTIIIYSCYHRCNFFETEQGGVMYCNRPYFDTTPLSNSYIITHENSRDKIPEKCPLRNAPLNLIYECDLND